MIEIILAICILAIGISSVMVLFTSGLKANNSAVASSALPDIVESAMARIRSLATHYGSDDSWGSYITSMPTSYTTENMSEFDVTNHPQEFLVSRTYSGSAQYNFLYRQLSRNEDGTLVPTFSAVVRVKRRAHNLVVVNPVTGAPLASEFAGKDQINDHLNNSFVELEMEISYPADVPFSAREVKNYRMELYNDKYNRICLP